MEINKKILRRQLCQFYKSFADDLHQKLNRYDVEYHICQRIARLRMLYAIDLLNNDRMVYINDIFPADINTPRAVDIYNSYIRHYRTGYDVFYSATVRSLADGVRLGKNDVRHLWRIQKTEEFDRYEKLCIIIDKHRNRIIGGHLTNY